MPTARGLQHTLSGLRGVGDAKLASVHLSIIPKRAFIAPTGAVTYQLEPFPAAIG